MYSCLNEAKNATSLITVLAYFPYFEKENGGLPVTVA
jgi:hypothetical protein